MVCMKDTWMEFSQSSLPEMIKDLKMGEWAVPLQSVLCRTIKDYAFTECRVTEFDAFHPFSLIRPLWILLSETVNQLLDYCLGLGVQGSGFRV